MKQQCIVVFYNARHYLPLRAANLAHLLCWGRYSKYRVVYINVAFNVPWRLLRQLDIGAIIFDTIFLSMHWSPRYFTERAAECMPVRELSCLKIAIPQDDFVNIAIVEDFLESIGVTHLLTCAGKDDWPRIYPSLANSGAKIQTVLTGYVDETRLPHISALTKAPRPIDLGYRAWKNPYWLGEHGQKKVAIAERVAPAARRRGLVVDIKNTAADAFLIGDEWFRFLGSCRAVLGTEGGASLVDRDGRIMERVESYVRQHPDADFYEVREKCFLDKDHTIRLFVLSPRHLEACMTRTCQLLLEGEYGGVLKPWRHYIPISEDYSNIDQALDALQDDELVEGIAERAYEEIVASGKWTYKTFVRYIEKSIIDPQLLRMRSDTWFPQVAYFLLRMQSAFLWHYAHLEASVPGRFLRKVYLKACAVRRRILALF